MVNHSHALQPTTVKLEPRLKSRLRRLGKEKRRSVHWLMKEAINRYLEKEEQLVALKQETLKRWQEAEQGSTVSHESVIAWLETWGTEKEGKRPKS